MLVNHAVVVCKGCRRSRGMERDPTFSTKLLFARDGTIEHSNTLARIRELLLRWHPVV